MVDLHLGDEDGLELAQRFARADRVRSFRHPEGPGSSWDAHAVLTGVEPGRCDRGAKVHEATRRTLDLLVHALAECPP